MQIKYIHYERQDIAGLYYREGNVYFENLDSKNGKIVRIIFPGQGRARDLVKKISGVESRSISILEDKRWIRKEQ